MLVGLEHFRHLCTRFFTGT